MFPSRSPGYSVTGDSRSSTMMTPKTIQTPTRRMMYVVCVCNCECFIAILVLLLHVTCQTLSVSFSSGFFQGGNTPLHLAAYMGRVEAVQLLLAKGASVHNTNRVCCSARPHHAPKLTHLHKNPEKSRSSLSTHVKHGTIHSRQTFSESRRETRRYNGRLDTTTRR